MKKLFSTIYCNRAGQGLMETMVALAIFVSGALAIVSLIVATLSSGQQSSNYTIAAALAWEGLDVVKNIRDSNYLAGLAWDEGLNGPDSTAIAVLNDGGAPITWSLNFAPNVMADAASRLYYGAPSGLYYQNTIQPQGTATNFYRLLTVDPTGTNFMKNVKSQVDWLEKGIRHSVIVDSKIYNWRGP